MRRRLKRPIFLSIRYKLFATYVLVIMIPFLLLLFIHISTTQQENKEAAVYASRKMLDETKAYLEYKSEAITEVLNFIAFNELVQKAVDEDSKPYEDIDVWHMASLQLSRLINQFRYNEDIDSIQIYMRQGLAGATENIDFLDMKKVESEAWYTRFSSVNAFVAWLPSTAITPGADSRELTILRKIPNEHDIQQFDGIVRARVKPAAMESVLNHAILTPNAAAFLFNDEGELLGKSDRFSYSDELVKEVSELYLDSDEVDNYYNNNYPIEGSRHLLGVQAIPHTDMKVALVVPYTDILQSSVKARNRIISIFLIVVPFMLPFSFFVAASATKRIRRLIVHVRKVKHGHFQLAPLPANDDEIGELTHNFNTMVQNISGLIEEKSSLGREVKNKELKALQAQINPHFLYNTLDLINAMAIESNAGDIKRVVDELAVFYKLSLSNGKEYVSLESELKHIEAYVRIQNMRFGDSVRLEFEVSRDLYDCQLPKILLQPLVENAILHGIMEKDSEEGEIRIAAWTDKGDLLIKVTDDGVGMSAEQLSTILQAPSVEGDRGGYGVRNIEERLQLSYGLQYGLRFDSSEGEGTSVLLRLPERRLDERGRAQ
ncbi:sensor histidine kinase [Paenibacillus lupini]|uniref:cache domain-containing sensor histidine kinase n=1 Tax=Paenibacillus lupini TaxID=1450204 RepID=UPI001424334A|nr:sensor histidine kinase [Paenibacillus lupini]NIK26187.1 two-component system sensor histidine kinase YesM [Paenibacillus lupini]